MHFGCGNRTIGKGGYGPIGSRAKFVLLVGCRSLPLCRCGGVCRVKCTLHYPKCRVEPNRVAMDDAGTFPGQSQCTPRTSGVGGEAAGALFPGAGRARCIAAAPRRWEHGDHAAPPPRSPTPSPPPLPSLLVPLATPPRQRGHAAAEGQPLCLRARIRRALQCPPRRAPAAAAAPPSRNRVEAAQQQPASELPMDEVGTRAFH